MNNLTPHQSKALNIDRSVSLTANAGSGKTFVLSQRFIEILLATDTQLNQIAAITFTEKAAGELFKRISDELYKASLVISDKSQAEKIDRLRKQIVSAKISTIHSFCTDLLREYPVEASIDANFIPINEQKASELIDLSIEHTLNDLLRDDNPISDAKELIRLLGSRSKLVAELAELIKKRKKVLFLTESFYSVSEVETVNRLSELFGSNFKILFNDKIPVILNQIAHINSLVLENKKNNERASDVSNILREYKLNDSTAENIKTLKRIQDIILTSGGTVRVQGYLSAKIKEELSEELNDIENFFNDLDEIALSDNYQEINRVLARYSYALVRTFQNVNTEYERKKNESGYLDFEDILLKTKKLFDDVSVRQSISKKYKYLLVDEYQDTNEIQYEIFLPVVDDLKSGNLFIVGDEKQSIYRFRDAELQVFSRTKADIQKVDGDESALTLPDSFRMAPNLCFFINYLFSELFKNPNLFFNEVSASALVSARNEKYPGTVEFIISDEENESEAELVAKRILKLRRENSDRLNSWNKIAVLVRKRSSFVELQKSFIKFQIPFNVIGGTGFYQKQSISDIYNYFSFLMNDKNDSALVGILRSPFFMVSDSEIFKLSLVEGSSYWEKLEATANSGDSSWLKIYNLLSEYKSLAKRMSIPLLLRKILSESDFISILSSRIDGQQELSNLNKLISLTSDFFTSEFNTLYDYVTFLNDAISGIIDEAQAQLKAGSDGVNILTIHQAKGLEFKAVFLFNCSESSLMNKVKARSFVADKDLGLLTKVPIGDNFFGEYQSAPVAGIYNLIESKKEIAELKRLLYVALTRAEDFLFISMMNEEKSTRKQTFAALINQGLRQDFNQDFITLEGELSYLKKDNGSFSTKAEAIKIEIPITRTLENCEDVSETNSNHSDDKKIILTKIADNSKGEVISATRFSTFSQCPLKYNFIYNYKLGELFRHSSIQKNFFGTKESDDYNRSELNSYLFDDETVREEFSRVKGQFIHYVLRKNINIDELDYFVDQKFRNIFNQEITEPLVKNIQTELRDFYLSSQYKFLNSFPNIHNEYEVYLKQEDYYLFGILDKLIIDDERILIVDFKTDSIDADEIQSKAKKYLPQLKFYAYIISRLFNKKKNIECRVIFTKHPEQPFTFEYDNQSDDEMKSGITKMIRSIRMNEYTANLDECSYCIFSDNHSNCIKKNPKFNLFSTDQ